MPVDAYSIGKRLILIFGKNKSDIYYKHTKLSPNIDKRYVNIEIHLFELDILEEYDIPASIQQYLQLHHSNTTSRISVYMHNNWNCYKNTSTFYYENSDYKFTFPTSWSAIEYKV